MEFSTSSLTTDAGRSTTSPAAMRAARAGGNTLIGIRRDSGPAAGMGGGLAFQKSGTMVPLARYCLSSEVPVAAKSWTMR